MEQILLETVARKVRDNGNRFEEVLRERERDNVRFAFLKDEAVRPFAFLPLLLLSAPQLDGGKTDGGRMMPQLPSYHYFRMLIDPDHEPPKVASFDDEVRSLPFPFSLSNLTNTSLSPSFPLSFTRMSRVPPPSTPPTRPKRPKTKNSVKAN